MSKELTIKVREEYFQNMKNAADALNQFFSSNFKNKNFPMVDEDNEEELEPCLFHILSWMNRLDTALINDSEQVEQIIDQIRDIPQKMGKYDNIMDTLSDEGDTVSLEMINSYIAYQMAQYMNDHKSDFEALLDGITTMKLFGCPSDPQYKKALALFAEPIPLNDIRDIIGDDNEYYIFKEEDYIKGIFRSDEITLPKELTYQKELHRFKNRQSYEPFNVVHDHGEDDGAPIQEQAEINFFSMVNPNHIRYYQNRFQPSQQFVTVVKNLIAGLEKCNTPEDVKQFLNDKHNHVNPDDYTCMVLPSILARVFSDEKMFQNRLFNEKNLKKYTDSYDSIMKQDKNVRQFKDYDVFSTFKADKEGTIQFLKDFLSLKLVSDPNAYISNHTLLVLFNIFDSRIYLDILYNVLPQSEKKGDYETEDGFVKSVRARINNNSNKSSPYTKPEKTQKSIDSSAPSVIPTSAEVTESALQMIHSLGDYDIADTPYLQDIILEACRMELSTLHDKSFQVGISEADVEEYIFKESHGYAFSGNIPNYMKDRIKTTDQNGKPDVNIEQTPLPEGVPANDIGSLIDSIDDRVDAVEPDANGYMDLSDGFGNQADVSPREKGSHIVYNITYNYNNSNNTTNTTDSHNTTDQSVNKTVSGTSNNSYNRNRKRIVPHSQSPTNRGSNNYNNDTSSSNTKDPHVTNTQNNTTLSTGKNVQEGFMTRRSKEPLLVEEGVKQTAGSLAASIGADTGVLPDTNPEPKKTLLTRAQDFDRKMLSKQEDVRRAANNAVQTDRALKQPFQRTKNWLTNFVDDILQRDEDEIKGKLMEDNNFRTLLKKVWRMLLKFEMFSVAYVLSPYIALMYAGFLGMKGYQSRSYKKEVQNEIMTEIEIIDHKISVARASRTKEGNQKAYELMRIRRKLMDKAAALTNSPIESGKPQHQRNYYNYDFDY